MISVAHAQIAFGKFTLFTRAKFSKAYGLFHRIIPWKLRMFVPIDAAGVGVPAEVLRRFRIVCIGEREAA